MKEAIKILIFSCLFFSVISVKGQALFHSDNSLLSLEDGSLLHVEGDIVHDNDAVTFNSGIIQLENDWVNNNPTLGFYALMGQESGVVIMSGFDQSVRGTSLTQFHDLRLENLSRKTMFVDAWVDSMLYIADAELAVNDNVMHVRNPNPNSIQWNSGFVSGDSLAGYLARSTNRNSRYMFPVGSENINNIYRAVEVIPSTPDSSVYAVRVAGIDPEFDFTGTSFTTSTGPFPRNSIGPQIYGINDRFYHNIARFYSSNTNQTLNTKIFYFNSDEIFPYEFNGISKWSNTNLQWEVDNFGVNFTNAYTNIGSPDKFMLGTIGDFSNDVYALTVKDKIIANIPQIFSPNNDGINDILYVYGDGIEEVEFVIYNRWGEKIFETKDKNRGWDGTFRGKKAQPGVYVYYIKASLNTSENIEASGDVTLVR